MRKYILHRTFVTQDGSVYQQRSKPYFESELPQLALQSTFATLVDHGTILAPELSHIERNVIESHYNPVANKNVIEQHFQPSYGQAETIAEVQPTVIDLTSLNSPDHVVQGAKQITLKIATVDELASLPYVSRKTAEKLVEALSNGTTFSSMADLDKWQKLGFGKSWADTSIVISEIE